MPDSDSVQHFGNSVMVKAAFQPVMDQMWKGKCKEIETNLELL